MKVALVIVPCLISILILELITIIGFLLIGFVGLMDSVLIHIWCWASGFKSMRGWWLQRRRIN